MRNLELYLRDSSDEHIITMIDEGTEEGRLFWSASGETYKWVVLLRAADLFWSPQESKNAEVALFRMREEGLRGDSPHIIVRCRDRYVYLLFITVAPGSSILAAPALTPTPGGIK